MRMGEKGFTIIEVVFATLLFSVAIVGLSQLLVVGFSQKSIDTTNHLSLLAINNMGERLLSSMRDNYSTDESPGGGDFGSCDSPETTYTLILDKQKNADMSPYSPIPEEVFAGEREKYQIEIKLTCDPGVVDPDDKLHLWEGYVRMRDSSSENANTIASIPFSLFQP